MRYQNWDILVFPDMCKIPLQEFKTSCQVVQDPETHSCQTSPHLLPTVTCFIPGLAAGTPYRISIHCWQNPEINRYVQSFKKPTDHLLFEARLLVDGRLVGSKWFQQAGPWPTVLDLSIDLDKNGEFEKLKFPTFHKELLSQSYWNAGDDLGRIKLIISEGFSRDNMTYPFDRIKNIASFSFQHAPLDVLESSSIAWPNAAMWRQVSFVAPYLAQQQSPRSLQEAVETHSHSPRRGLVRSRAPSLVRSQGAMLPPATIFPRQQHTYDPFADQINSAFHNWRQPSADVSMPDYSSSSTHTRAHSRQVTDPMSIAGAQDRQFESLGIPDSHFDSLCEALMPSAPVNTPQNEENTSATVPATRVQPKRSATVNKDQDSPSKEADDEEPVAALAQETVTIAAIKSRKENLQASPLGAKSGSTSVEETVRKVSQTFVSASDSGTKRQRIVTPAATKAIDDEDDPKSSPSTRKASRASMKQEGAGPRRVLSNLTNVGN